MTDRVLFVMGDWPNPSETFLRREMSELAALGLDFEILALRQTPRAPTLTDFPKLAERVWFLPRICSPESVVGETLAVLTHPLLTVRLAGRFQPENGFRPGVPFRLPGCVWASRRVACGGFTRIHAQFASLPGAVGSMLAQWLTIPFSFSCHARDIYVPSVNLEHLMQDAELVVTCTESNRTFLTDRFPEAAEKLHRVYHGIPLSEPTTHRTHRDVPLILAVGRLVAKKGFANLVSACKLLSRRGVRYRCEIVGDGPLRRQLARFVSDLDPVNVELVGWCSPQIVRRKLEEATCLVVPSVVAADGDRDGIPNVILEAMAVGTPVVASGVLGIPEAVRDGETGLLVEPNDVGAFADAVTRLLKDDALREDLASHARELVARQFDPRRNAQTLNNLLTGTA